MKTGKHGGAMSSPFVRYPRRARRFLLLAVVACFAAASAAAQGPAYDIVYVWRPDLEGVSAYKEKVSDILGPGVARRLRVVRAGGKYGLVYVRKGGRDSAAAAAKVHTRFLTARGLSPAVPVRAQDWASPQAAVPAVDVRAAVPVRAQDWASPQAAVPAVDVRAAVSAAGETSSLESSIENYIGGLRRSGRIKGNERSSWLVYDIKADKKLVSINEEMPLEAASLIKPFIALAYLHTVEAGRKPYNREVRGRMERMIQGSDNQATNWLMRRLGGPKAVQGFLKREYGGIFRNTSIVEYIPAGGRAYRNKASALDYSRFLYALWTGVFPGSAELKRLMSLPNPDRLYTSAPGIPAGTAVYDKTGTTSHLCGNMGILVSRRADGESFPYIIVGVIQKERAARSFSSWMRSRGDVIRRVSEMVYKEISGSYRFADFDPRNAASRTAGGGNEPAEGREGG